jgi:hypothetical protein
MSNNINIPGQILSQSIKLEKSLDTSLQTLNNLYDSVKVLTPAKSRQMYDKLSNSIESKVNELNGLKNDLNNAIISINNSINKTSEFYEILEKMQLLLNKGKIGTLEGITRENIKTGKFPAENLYEAEKEILNQDYDEFKEVNKVNVTGGFSKKRKGTKRKGTKRKGKKSKITKTHRFHKFIRK